MGLDSYYQSTPKEMAKAMDESMEKTFRRCIPKRKRKKWLRIIQSLALKQFRSQN